MQALFLASFRIFGGKRSKDSSDENEASVILLKLLKRENRQGVGKAAMTCLILLAGIWIVTFSLKSLWRATHKDPNIDTRPVLVAVQKLGTLHTVSYEMKDILVQETNKEAEGWLQGVPGADSVIQWATRNKVTVTATGKVEAGVDLSQITAKNLTVLPQPDGSKKLRVHLPPVVVYPPNVRLHVESNESGLFWNDTNIVPKAQEEAARRFLESAERDNIRAKAQTNAIEALQKLQQNFGETPVEFTFEP